MDSPTSATTQRRAFLELLQLLSTQFTATEDPYYITTAIAAADGIYDQTWAVEDLQKVVQLSQVLATADPAHPALGSIYNNLGNSFRERWDQMGLLDDLENAISAAQEAVAVTPQGHPEWMSRVSDLGCYFSIRFDCLGGLDDIEKAIQVSEQVVAATLPDDPELSGRLYNLSYALHSRFERLGDEDDIQRAVQAGEKAVEVSADPDRAAALSVLGVMLNARFGRLGHAEDVDNAILASQEAVRATMPDDPDLPSRLHTLGNTCRSRFELCGDLDDLSMAVAAGQMALNLTPQMHPDRANILNSLSYHLWERFQRLGDAEDLGSAIVASQEALAATPVTHPDRAHRWSNLGQWLTTRFSRFGDLDDLEGAVRASEEGMAATPEDHPDRAGRLGNLSNCFHRRFQRLGAVDDLQRAIQANSEALACTPLDHPDRPSLLMNWSHKLHSRFTRLGDLADLENSIQASEEAIADTPPGHPALAGMLDNLSHQFHSRFERFGAMEDLESAIRRVGEAVVETAEDHPLRASMLRDLGLWLRTRYLRLNNQQDLQIALEASGEAVATVHPDDPDRANTLLLLGYLLNSAGDVDRSLEVVLEAWECDTAPPRVRIRAAYFAASLLAAAGRWKDASPLLGEAVRILPTVSQRILDRQDHEHILSEFTQLAAVGIAAALEVQSPPSECLSLLEAGRGIIIGLAIDCRSDLSELHAANPDLFERLTALRTAIDSPPTSLRVHGEVYQPVDEERHRQRVKATSDIDETLAAIRQLRGFEGLQLPPSSESLIAMAAEGPIIIFNTTQLRSDAIILTSSVKSLSLPKMTYAEVADRMKELPGLSRGKRSTYPARNKKMLKTLLWLWEVAVEPVLEELGLGPASESELPRIWWIGVGLLASAPFHAAGDHSRGSTRNTLSRAISSYTPTLKALSYARQKKLDLGQDSRLLLVTMPTTPDTPAIPAIPAHPGAAAIPGTPAIPATLDTPFVPRTHGTPAIYRIPAVPGTNSKAWKPLPNAIMEVEEIMQVVNATADPLDSPNVTEVLHRLPDYHVIHFACHGVSDRHNPSESHLLLHGNDSSHPAPGKLTVGAISALHMDRAQVAYLSACCSADNAAVQLADEAIHIASGFQLAGFSHVLATLWESNDAACRLVAREFYGGLFGRGGGRGEHRVVSEAFHRAVGKLRDEVLEQPIRWASFIHSGA